MIRYKAFCREEPLRFDVLVEQCVLVENKAAEIVHPIHKAKLLSYMKLMHVPLGLLINFHVEKLTTGVSRSILPCAGKSLRSIALSLLPLTPPRPMSGRLV